MLILRIVKFMKRQSDAQLLVVTDRFRLGIGFLYKRLSELLPIRKVLSLNGNPVREPFKQRLATAVTLDSWSFPLSRLLSCRLRDWFEN